MNELCKKHLRECEMRFMVNFYILRIFQILSNMPELLVNKKLVKCD